MDVVEEGGNCLACIGVDYSDVDCLNWRLFGMMEKCMRPSVELGGNGKVVVFWIKVRISSGVVLIGTVKWTKVDDGVGVWWSTDSLGVLNGGGCWPLFISLTVLNGGGCVMVVVVWGMDGMFTEDVVRARFGLDA